MKGLLFLPRNFLLSKLSFRTCEVSLFSKCRWHYSYANRFFFFLRIQNTRRKSQITVIITDGLNAIIHELIIIIPSITITPITLMVARSIYFVRLVCLMLETNEWIEQTKFMLSFDSLQTFESVQTKGENKINGIISADYRSYFIKPKWRMVNVFSHFSFIFPF